MVMVIAVVLMSATSLAQQADAPVLTESDRLRVQNALLTAELAQERAVRAAREFEEARTAYLSLLQSLQLDGFRLDPSTGVYTPVADETPVVPEPAEEATTSE